MDIKESHLLASSTHVQAYDNPKGIVLGIVLLPINLGPIEKSTELQVLDIPAAFNLLLESLLLHEHQAVPSILHQKIKMLIKGEVVMIEADSLCATSQEPILEAEHD